MKRLVQAAMAVAAISTALVCDAANADQKPAIASVHGARGKTELVGRSDAPTKADGYRLVVFTMPSRPSDPFLFANASALPASRYVHRRIYVPAPRVPVFTMHPTPMDCDVGDNEFVC